jgi:hypothetical protein
MLIKTLKNRTPKTFFWRTADRYFDNQHLAEQSSYQNSEDLIDFSPLVTA